MSNRVTATQLARSLGTILGRVRYGGESFLVERNGVPVARVTPLDAAPSEVREPSPSWDPASSIQPGEDTTTHTSQLLRDFERLSPQLQRLLLELARNLTAVPQPRGARGADIRELNSGLDDDSANEMRQALQDCERVDDDGW